MNDKEMMELFIKLSDVLHNYHEKRDLMDQKLTPKEVEESINKRFGHNVSNPVIKDLSHGDVSSLDFELNFNGKKVPIRMLTQNPKKRDHRDRRYPSRHAMLAKKGHRITWVLHLKYGHGKKGIYKAYIQNNTYNSVVSNRTHTMETSSGYRGRKETVEQYVQEMLKTLRGIPTGQIHDMIMAADSIGILK